MPNVPPTFKMPGTKTSDEKRPNAHQRGYTRQWMNMARRYRQQNPCCVMCAAEGRDGVPAEHVDHVIPFRGNIRLRDDPNNWQALCAECHGKKTRAEMLAEDSPDERPAA